MDAPFAASSIDIVKERLNEHLAKSNEIKNKFN